LPAIPDSHAFDLRRVPTLDFKSHIPLYAQLAERFGMLIEKSQGSMIGKILPSESECMTYFRVSRPTVRQAMAQLFSQGLITRGRGRGTFVAPRRVDYDLGRSIEAEIRSDTRVVKFRVLEWETITPPMHIRKALQLRRNEKVERIIRLRMLNERPFAFEERYLPSRYRRHVTKEALSSKLGISLIKFVTGERPAKVAFTLRGIAADAEIAHKLAIVKGAPLLSSQHTYCLADGVPVLFGTVFFLGETYEFSFQARIHMP
jgi:GntR family transcriptional regulator